MIPAHYQLPLPVDQLIRDAGSPGAGERMEVDALIVGVVSTGCSEHAVATAHSTAATAATMRHTRKPFAVGRGPMAYRIGLRVPQPRHVPRATAGTNSPNSTGNAIVRPSSADL